MDRPVIFLREVRRELTLEKGGERTEGDVVGTCRAGSGEGKEVEVAISSGVDRPGGAVVAYGYL